MTLSVCAPAVSALSGLLRLASHPADVEAEKRRRFEAEWQARKHLPTRDRIAWLRRSEVIAFYGAAHCRNLAHQLTKKIEPVLCSLPTETLFEAWDSTGQLPPGLGVVGGAVRFTHSPIHHRHGVRLRLSKQETRNGPAGRATRRFTPPQAVETEDFLDSMTPAEAERYEYPASPSASVITAIGELRGREGR